MKSLTHDQVRHIAKLARLTLSDDEIARYATELTSIFSYIELLGEVDTAGVEPTEQMTADTGGLRADEPYAEPLATPDALLATSPLPIEEHQIVTPSSIG